ncbi:MAG: peptide chain release factor N(5)-glutamine methyltransferase [Rhodospirillaceae bacterium]
MPRSVTQVLQQSVMMLEAAGIEDSRLDTRLLAAAVMKIPQAQLFFRTEAMMQDHEYDLFQSYLLRRIDFEPVSRILGQKEFWSLPFVVTPDTLDPRPDSETVVDGVLLRLSKQNRTASYILDVGTGTGCLLLALLSEFEYARGVGLDLSPGAAKTASENAEKLGFGSRSAFVVGDWLASLDGRFDVIVSNPPYIAEEDIERLCPDVRNYDPSLALSGGVDGLKAYKKLIPDCWRLLSDRGILMLEIGQGQEKAVTAILMQAGLCEIELHTDLAGIIRCVSATKH